MKDVINTIKNPIDAIEKKFGGSWKKVLILLGIVLGIFIVTDLISEMYGALIASKTYSGSINFNALKNVQYVDVLLKYGLLKNIIILGSVFGGVYIYSTITKKEFKLVDALTIVLVAYMANYLLQAVLNILFMFKFMYTTKFLVTIGTILLGIANLYTTTLFLFGLHKTFGLKVTNKDVINLVITFAVMIAVREFLLLAL